MEVWPCNFIFLTRHEFPGYTSPGAVFLLITGKNMFVKLWMNENPIVVNQEQTLSEADELMRKHGIRRLPVVDTANELVGMITREDIRKAMPITTSPDDLIAGVQAPVAAFMTAGPITADPMDPLETAAQTMRKNKIGGLPVVADDGTLLGILTEADICRALMDILGAGEGGARIELLIGKTTREVYETFEIFKDFDMLVRTVAVYPDFSENHQLLTIRVQGEDLEKMLDALWKSGCKVHRIQVTDSNGE
jgi:acetoin utilization protein AcuB